MKSLFTYLVCICFTCIANAQSNELNNDSFKLIKIIPGVYSRLEVDATGNIYLITSTNQLKKLSPNGDSLSVFNDVRRYGNVSYIDVSNPLRPLVYYKNFSTVIMLDRLLTVRTTLNLRRQQIFRVNVVTNSYDNNLWIFDEQEIKLKKINEEGKTLLESNDLRLLSEKIPAANFITDVENSIYLYDPEQGLFVFDQYAAFKYRLPFIHWSSVTVNNNNLLGIADKKLNIYNMATKNLRSVAIPSEFMNAISIRVMNNKLFVLLSDSLCEYEVL